jgi:ATP-dependent Lon protease
MGKSKSRSKTIPVIPLQNGQVLLPGVTLRISIAYRPDIAALLARIYSVSSNPRGETPMVIGCVPLGSRMLSPDGKRLIEDVPNAADNQTGDEDSRLFGFGTLAKITGVQGRVQGELALIVEGLSRFKVEKITQERPYYEASIISVRDQGKLWFLLLLLPPPPETVLIAY